MVLVHYLIVSNFFYLLAFLRIKGLPFNCEPSQTQYYPLNSCNRNDYELFGGRSTKYNYPGCIEQWISPEYPTSKCNHFKVCQHSKGLSDCLPINENNNDIQQQLGLISKVDQGSKCPSALIMDEYHEKTDIYASIHNQEGANLRLII